MKAVFRYITASFFAWILIQNLTIAQPPDRPRNPATDIKERKTEIYYLKNEKGDLVLVPSLSLDEYEEFVRQRLGYGPNSARTPQYSFSKEIRLTGTHEKERVSIEATFVIKINETEAKKPAKAVAEDEPSADKPPVENRWVRVPLKFNQASLKEPPKYQGDGKSFTEFDSSGDGYVVWLLGSPGSEHSLTLRLLASVSTLGTERRIAFNIPAAPARLELRVASPNAIAGSLSQTTTIDKTERNPDTGTMFSIVGASGDFLISWRDSQEPSAKAKPVLDVAGNLLARVEGRNRLHLDARLRVRSYSQPFQDFVVRLPVGFRYAAEPSVGATQEYQVSVANDVGRIEKDSTSKGKSETKSEGSATDIAAARQAISVRLARESVSSPEIRIPMDWLGSTAEIGTIEIGTIEVENAVRQTGVIEVAVDADLNVTWKESAAITRVDTISEASRQQRVVAKFEYDTQPSSLKLEIRPKTTRINVEPVYHLDVQPNRLELQATFRYSVIGGKVGALELLRKGWNVTRVLPGTLISPDANLSNEETMSIPLALDLQGNFEIQALAVRDLKSDEQSFSVDAFPRPQNADRTNSTMTISSATIVVTVADNVDVELIGDQLRGLISEPIAPTISLPNRQQTPLVFREQPGPDGIFLAARWKTRSRSMSASVRHLLSLARPAPRMETRLSYQISYDATDHIVIEGRRDVILNDSLRATVDGRVLPVKILDEGTTDEEPSVNVRARVDLLERRLGSCELILEYPVPKISSAPGQVARHSLSLLTPAAEPQLSISSTRLALNSPANVRLSIVDELWTLVSAEERSEDGTELITYSTAGSPTSVLVDARTGSLGRSGTIAHRAWVQTWFSAAERRDRATFHLTTSEKRLRIHLPDGVKESDLEVALDHRPLKDVSITGSEIQIDLPSSEHSMSHIIEVWCWLKRGAKRWQPESIETIRLISVDRVDRLFWEVALPPNEHLVKGPTELVPEFTWQWHGGVWQRTSHYSQRELEEWSGASIAKPIPEGTNRYVYSGLGGPSRIELATTSRANIVLIAAGPILLFGMLVVTFGWWIRPVFVFAVGVALSVVAVVFPDPSVVFGQASVIGLVLVLVSRALRPRPQTAAVRPSPKISGSTFVRNESKSLEFHSPGSVAGSSVQRSTTPVAIPVSGSQVQP